MFINWLDLCKLVVHRVAVALCEHLSVSTVRRPTQACRQRKSRQKYSCPAFVKPVRTRVKHRPLVSWKPQAVGNPIVRWRTRHVGVNHFVVRDVVSVDCAWSPWMACRCDNGKATQTRTRSYLQETFNGSQPCQGAMSETQKCKVDNCVGAARLRSGLHDPQMHFCSSLIFLDVQGPMCRFQEAASLP